MEAGSLQKACKGAVWRSCWWLEGLETATWMPSWLQRWISKANLNKKSTKFVSGSLHVGGNLRSYGQENRKLAKRLVKPVFFEGPRWPSIGPRRPQELSCKIFPLIVVPFWAHLGPILGSLGPSLALLEGPGGHLEADFSFGKLDLGVQGGQKLSFQKHQTT